MAEIKVIAGLGNPGKSYERTRHNMGFRLLDMLAEKLELDPGWKNWSGTALVSCAAGPLKAALIKPQGFMNNSGTAVSQYLRYRRLEPGNLLVVIDDFSIPLGAIRLRASGSAGGHNGLSSIIEHLGTSEFARLRLGIGPVPRGVDPADYVLSNFTSSENEQVVSMLQDGLVVIESVLTKGLDKTISQMPKRQGKGRV